MENLKKLLEPVLKDSFGGIMYNVANKEKYNTEEIMEAWNALSPVEHSMSGGIIKGAINFLKS